MLIPAATCYTLILPQIHTSCDHGVPHADRAQVTRTHTCGSIKQLRGLLMITSIMRLLIPGANFTSRGRFQREALCVCVHLYEETWTHPSTGTKKKQCSHPPFLSQCYICAQSTFTEWFMELFRHVTDELLCNVAPCNKPAFLV